MSVGQKSYQSVRSGSSNADFHYEIERTTTSAALPELGVISGNGNCAISVVARAMADAVGCPNVTPLTSDQSGQYIAGTLQPSTLAQTTDIEQIKNNLLEAFNIESIKDNLLQAFNNDQTQMNAYIQNEGFGKDIQRFAQEQAIASTRVFQSAALKSAGHTADTTPVVADHV
jgi:hypothetical protein